jgi:hypothetical protein
LVWNWFILNGPHGESFAWHKEVAVAPREIDLLARFIEENSATNPDFRARAREIALESLNMEDPVLVRKGIQVLTVVGSDEDMSSVRELLNHRNKAVVKDARAALFERQIREEEI